MIDPEEFSLSKAGARRREAMLSQLVTDMHIVHRRRRVRRGALLVIAPLLLIAASLTLARGLTPQTPGANANQIVENNPKEAHSSPRESQSLRESRLIVRVDTDPTATSRHRATAISKAIRMDDATLLETLAQLDRPSGIIRSEGKAWLTDESFMR